MPPLYEALVIADPHPHPYPLLADATLARAESLARALGGIGDSSMARGHTMPRTPSGQPHCLRYSRKPALPRAGSEDSSVHAATAATAAVTSSSSRGAATAAPAAATAAPLQPPQSQALRPPAFALTPCSGLALVSHEGLGAANGSEPHGGSLNGDSSNGGSHATQHGGSSVMAAASRPPAPLDAAVAKALRMNGHGAVLATPSPPSSGLLAGGSGVEGGEGEEGGMPRVGSFTILHKRHPTRPHDE